MPLHLLGKKSWNVYNADNVARVRRDEADARAREEAAEQRMQEADAARRLAILRGETPPPLLPEPEAEENPAVLSREQNRDRDPLEGLGGSGSGGAGRERRKRKRPGEDDTDFEMRVARERAAVGDRVREELGRGLSQSSGSKSADVAIVDKAGHIDLFGGQDASAAAAATIGSRTGEKNPEYEREAAKKRRELEDQYTMRFANAAGRDGGLAGGAAPWYVKPGDGKAADEAEFDAPTKDVWGNEDPARKARSAARLGANDPLAMMKSGARRVREVEKERKKDAEQREREIKELKREERRREKRRRREGRLDDGDHDVGELEGFSLDAPARLGIDKEHGRDHRERQDRSHRDRERRGHHHHNDRSRHREHGNDTRDDRRRHDAGHSRHRHRSDHGER